MLTVFAPVLLSAAGAHFFVAADPQQRAGELVVMAAGAAVNTQRVIIHHVRMGAGVLKIQKNRTA